MIVNPGIRRFLGSAIQRLFNSASFYAPLTHSLVLERGTGSPSFTRATTATVTNNDGYLVTGVAGEIGFVGARRIYNKLTNTGWSGAASGTYGTVPTGWTADVGTGTLTVASSATYTGHNQITFTATAQRPFIRLAVAVAAYSVNILSVRVVENASGEPINDIITGSSVPAGSTETYSVNGSTVAASYVPVAGDVIEYKIATAATAGTPNWRIGLGCQGAATGSVTLVSPQLEDVTAQTTQTAGEYVSVGALDYRSELNRLYLSLPGTASHDASSPDKAAPLGDMTVVFHGAATDWTPAAPQYIVSKHGGAGQLGIQFYISATVPQLAWSPEGSSIVNVAATAGVPFSDGNAGYVAATLDVNNGAGGYSVNFYTSTDGSTWTQLGATVSGAGITAQFNNTAAFSVGGYAGGTGTRFVGKVFSAQVYDGIPPMLGGSDSATPAVDFNPHRDATTPTGTITSSTTGEVWTINGASSVVRSDYYHGSMVDGVKCFPTDIAGNALPTSYTYDAVSLNGVAGTYVSTPDSVAASITGDIDIRVKAALTNWSSGAIQALVAKRSGSDGEYVFRIAATGELTVFWYASGVIQGVYSSTAATGIAAGATKWVRVTRDIGVEVVFYLSDDGMTWTRLGDVVSAVGSLAASDSAIALDIGSQAGSNSTAGRIYQAQIYNGINGTLAVDFDASRYAGGTTLTGSTGETWTLQGNAVIHPTNIPMLGYQAQGARTNLCLQSNAFTTTWADYSGTLTLAQNVVGPDGATSAWTATDDGGAEGRFQSINLTNASVYTCSIFVGKTTGAPASYPSLEIETGTSVWGCCINTTAGTATAITTYSTLTPIAPSAIRVNSFNDDFWRVEFTFTATATAAYLFSWLAAFNLTGTGTLNSAATGSAVFYGAQVDLGSFASSYIATTTTAVTRNADVESVSTSGNIVAAAGSVYLEFTPTHSPSGTIAFWGTYVDASNYTAILHDATNLIFRKRIAGVNYDATIANAFVSGTTYKACATWGASGTSITLNGTEGTPHANTTAAQIAATMQVGADGNSLQQPGAGTTNLRIWQRQLSSPEGVAVTA